MYEERHEDGESKGWVGMVGSIGNEALWELVQGNSNRSLKAYAHESIFGDVVMVLCFGIIFIC
jgi:hypothetical protein